jgi:hypothetical protein
MSNSVTIHESRIRFLKQHPGRMMEMYPPDSFADAAKANKPPQSLPHNWFIDGTLRENERAASKVADVRIGNSLVSFSREP